MEPGECGIPGARGSPGSGLGGGGGGRLKERGCKMPLGSDEGA